MTAAAEMTAPPTSLPTPQLRCVRRTVTTSDGVHLAVRDYVSDRDVTHTLVLLHGLCLSQDSWTTQIRYVIHRFGHAIRVISYDHRGHGDSSGARLETYSIDRLGAD